MPWQNQNRKSVIQQEQEREQQHKNQPPHLPNYQTTMRFLSHFFLNHTTQILQHSPLHQSMMRTTTRTTTIANVCRRTFFFSGSQRPRSLQRQQQVEHQYRRLRRRFRPSLVFLPGTALGFAQGAAITLGSTFLSCFLAIQVEKMAHQFLFWIRPELYGNVQQAYGLTDEQLMSVRTTKREPVVNTTITTTATAWEKPVVLQQQQQPQKEDEKYVDTTTERFYKELEEEEVVVVVEGKNNQLIEQNHNSNTNHKTSYNQTLFHNNMATTTTAATSTSSYQNSTRRQPRASTTSPSSSWWSWAYPQDEMVACSMTA